MAVSGVSTRQSFLGVNYATGSQGGVELLNNRGIDSQGTKHLTTKERQTQMADGFKKAHGNQISDQAHRNQAAAANANAKATYANAAANGNITKMEQRNINSANRDAVIANKEVQVDTARTHLGHVQRNAARDGQITLAERSNISSAQGNLNRLTGELNTLKKNDARLDARDARLNNAPGAKFSNAIQDAIGIGKKVPTPWSSPSTAISKPQVQVQPNGSAHVGMKCGCYAGGGLKHCGNTGIAGGLDLKPAPRNLSFGQQINMMQEGSKKAQYTGEHFKHQLESYKADSNVKNTYANAKADGHISLFERRDINNANRDANIANKQVAYDKQSRHVGSLELQYASDGRLSMGERFSLREQRAKLSGMGAELDRLKNQDKAADARDAAFKANPFNQFRNAAGVASHQLGKIAENFRPMIQPRPLFAGAAGLAVSAATGGLAGIAAQGAAALAAQRATNMRTEASAVYQASSSFVSAGASFVSAGANLASSALNFARTSILSTASTFAGGIFRLF